MEYVGSKGGGEQMEYEDVRIKEFFLQSGCQGVTTTQHLQLFRFFFSHECKVTLYRLQSSFAYLDDHAGTHDAEAQRSIPAGPIQSLPNYDPYQPIGL